MRKEIVAKGSYVLKTSWQNQSIITMDLRIPNGVSIYFINDANLECIKTKSNNNWDADGQKEFSIPSDTEYSTTTVVENGLRHMLFINNNDQSVNIEISAQENPDYLYPYSSSTAVSGLL